ncbi:hypothetical protein OHA40_31895 [Nocardia sp. NBC_00508]|uniref:hypothetical protein n=1 Tax=Nocardia sp. NBC_00508 TaxID=2975992 RepID=UPI002E81A9EF|nr:hypothetical protein [Nocardia sp. NBC_00508]WUD66119.1 hypothetical protein OHA40_31895 [Nocardia sp. NBC_00508]
MGLTEPATHLRADIAEFWRSRRRRQPIFWHDSAPGRPGFWVVCGYDPALAIYRDSKRFTSQRGNVLLTLLAGRDHAAGKMLAVTDPPPAHRLRRLMTAALTRGAVRALAPRIRERTRRVVAGFGQFRFRARDRLLYPDLDHEHRAAPRLDRSPAA